MESLTPTPQPDDDREALIAVAMELNGGHRDEAELEVDDYLDGWDDEMLKALGWK